LGQRTLGQAAEQARKQPRQPVAAYAGGGGEIGLGNMGKGIWLNYLKGLPSQLKRLLYLYCCLSFQFFIFSSFNPILTVYFSWTILRNWASVLGGL
jgi:hypothetical protein